MRYTIDERGDLVPDLSYNPLTPDLTAAELAGRSSAGESILQQAAAAGMFTIMFKIDDAARDHLAEMWDGLTRMATRPGPAPRT